MKKAHRLGTKEHNRTVRALIKELARDPEIIFAYLYGSCAESRPFHDVDVGVFLREPDEQSQTVLTLAQRLSSVLRMPVDVRALNEAPMSFLYHVLRGELLISHDDDLLSSLIENTVRRYLDIAPLLRRATKEAFAE
jgi:hypothetical protein